MFHLCGPQISFSSQGFLVFLSSCPLKGFQILFFHHTAKIKRKAAFLKFPSRDLNPGSPALLFKPSTDGYKVDNGSTDSRSRHLLLKIEVKTFDLIFKHFIVDSSQHLLHYRINIGIHVTNYCESTFQM